MKKSIQEAVAESIAARGDGSADHQAFAERAAARFVRDNPGLLDPAVMAGAKHKVGKAIQKAVTDEFAAMLKTAARGGR